MKNWSNLLLKQKSAIVPWTTRQAFYGILITIILFVVISVVVSLIPLVRLPATSVPLSPAVDSTHAIATFLYSVLVEGIFLIIPFYFAYRMTPPDETGKRHIWRTLGAHRFQIKPALLMIVSFFVAIIIINELYSLIITYFHLPLQVNSQPVYAQGKIAPITTGVTLVLATFYAPFCEEIFFRSFAFMGLKRDLSLLWAVVWSALIFAAAHFDPASFPVLFCIGVALAIVRWRSGSIWPGMILHLLNNGLSALLIVLALRGINL